jgi:uncharacterized delta-60 repeat protein
LVQPDGAIVVVGTQVVSATDSNFEVVRLTPTGAALDPTFGSGPPATPGVAYVDFGGIDEAYGVARRPSDGAILVVGRTSGVGGGAIAVAALTSSGAPDPTLEGTGRKVIDATTADDEGRAIAVQPDENVLIGGTSAVSTGLGNFLLYRMSPSGVLDVGEDTVDGTGPATVDWGGDDRCSALALDPITGDVVLAGTSGSGPDTDYAVARFAPTGTLDPVFAGVGARLVDIDDHDRCSGVQVDTVGRTLLSGHTLDVATFSMTAVRLGQTGAVDASWNANPSASFPHNGAGVFQHHLRESPPGFWSQDGVLCSLLQPDGSLVLGGNSAPALTPVLARGAVLRLDPEGRIDPTFGAFPPGGNVFAFPPPRTTVFAMAPDGAGRIVLAGQLEDANDGATFGYVARIGG